jgi:hypothetical protein
MTSVMICGKLHHTQNALMSMQLPSGCFSGSHKNASGLQTLQVTIVLAIAEPIWIAITAYVVWRRYLLRKILKYKDRIASFVKVMLQKTTTVKKI